MNIKGACAFFSEFAFLNSDITIIALIHLHDYQHIHCLSSLYHVAYAQLCVCVWVNVEGGGLNVHCSTIPHQQWTAAELPGNDLEHKNQKRTGLNWSCATTTFCISGGLNSNQKPIFWIMIHHFNRMYKFKMNPAVLPVPGSCVFTEFSVQHLVLFNMLVLSIETCRKDSCLDGNDQKCVKNLYFYTSCISLKASPTPVINVPWAWWAR